MKLLVLVLALYGCGYNDTIEPTHEPSPNEVMRQLYSERLDEAKEWQDGWPNRDCDGLVWAGVSKAAGVDTDLYIAFYDGRFERRPGPSCYPNDENNDGRPDSRSTISNDGMVAAMLGMAMSGDREMARTMAAYGERNNWVYGKPWPEGIAEVYLKPWFQGLLGRIADQGRSYSRIPLTLQYSSEDYVAHIQTLAMLAEQKTKGGISTKNIELLKRYHERDPSDYLIRSVYAQYNERVSKPFTLVQPPSYVRGERAGRLALAHWLLAARVYLNL